MILNVKLRETDNSFKVDFKDVDSEFGAKFSEIQKVTEYVGGEEYEGEYVVTPKVTEQSLPTKEKVLIEDITIKEIPFYNVSNASGGNTVYIGDKI